MPAYLDNIDANFSWNGDFDLDAGDIRQSTQDALQSLLDQIHSICASATGDWEIYPNRGAGLDDFVGEPNNRSTGDRLRERLMLSFISSELVDQKDLDIRVIPVHIHKVLIVIKINALPTPFNKLDDGQILQTSLVFDSLEQELFFLDKVPQLTNS
jgi:hypothetical protein